MNDNRKFFTRAVIKKIRLGYADQLIVPRSFEPGQPEKYGCTLLMPAGHPGIEQIEAIADAAAMQRWGIKKSDWPKPLRGLTRDPIIKDCAHFPKIGITEPGWSFARASSQEPPGIVDAAVRELNKADQRGQVYSGRWATVSLNAFAYARQTGSGVSLGLGNIQLLNHDQRLGAPRPKPGEEFDPEDVPDADNDDDEEDFGPVHRRPR